MTQRYMSEEEFEIFSPLVYVMDYNTYSKDMESKEDYLKSQDSEGDKDD